MSDILGEFSDPGASIPYYGDRMLTPVTLTDDDVDSRMASTQLANRLLVPTGVYPSRSVEVVIVDEDGLPVPYPYYSMIYMLGHPDTEAKWDNPVSGHFVDFRQSAAIGLLSPDGELTLDTKEAYSALDALEFDQYAQRMGDSLSLETAAAIATSIAERDWRHSRKLEDPNFSWHLANLGEAVGSALFPRLLDFGPIIQDSDFYKDTLAGSATARRYLDLLVRSYENDDYQLSKVRVGQIVSEVIRPEAERIVRENTDEIEALRHERQRIRDLANEESSLFVEVRAVLDQAELGSTTEYGSESEIAQHDSPQADTVQSESPRLIARVKTQLQSMREKLKRKYLPEKD